MLLSDSLRQPEQVLQLAGEDEIAVPEHLLRARLVEVGEEDLGLGERLADGLFGSFPETSAGYVMVVPWTSAKGVSM